MSAIRSTARRIAMNRDFSGLAPLIATSLYVQKHFVLDELASPREAVLIMDVLRTPDSRFENLEDYPFSVHYVDVAASDTQPLRMHYLDEGPHDGPPIVLLHGEPTWSYLYRTMIPPLAEAGKRVLAPALIGFGRSDKPSRIEDYTYLRHVEWVTAWFERLRLKEVTLFVQDWGSLIGLRIAAEQSDRIARVVVANGFLPAAQ